MPVPHFMTVTAYSCWDILLKTTGVNPKWHLRAGDDLILYDTLWRNN